MKEQRQEVNHYSSLPEGKKPLSYPLAVSIVIPTYRREEVLLDTIAYLLRLGPAPVEILIVDQTPEHEKETELALNKLAQAGKIRWLRLSEPSITHAMNVGLQQASQAIVLFLDDDIIPCADLIAAHAIAQSKPGCNVVVGQVLQPGEVPISGKGIDGKFQFCSTQRQFVGEFIGCNFSVKREEALRLGGFDENFVQVAYRYEAEYSSRVLAAGGRILFEPDASIRHLKTTAGGTRSYGQHLTTIKPSHSVGEYYYALRAKGITNRWFKILARPLRSIRTRHHLTRPWWILPTLVAEALGLIWALFLALRGPRLIADIAGRQKNHE